MNAQDAKATATEAYVANMIAMLNESAQSGQMECSVIVRACDPYEALIAEVEGERTIKVKELAEGAREVTFTIP